MANITDPRAILFVNERVRPIAEKLRALEAEAADMLTEWFGEDSALIANDSSPVADGREAEGVSRLTGADVNSVLGIVSSVHTTLSAVGVSDVLSKPCVRALKVE